MDRDDDAGSLAALIFVDGDRPRKSELIHLLLLVDDMPIVELHTNGPALGIDGPDKADITVEDLFLVVVLHLDDFVIEDEQTGFCAALAKVLLKACVQLLDAALSSPHRRETLDLFPGIELEFLRNSLGHELEDRRADFCRLFGGKEKKVPSLIFKKGHLSTVDAVGVLDDF